MNPNEDFLDKKEEKESAGVGTITGQEKKTRTRKAKAIVEKTDDIPVSETEEIAHTDIVTFEYIDNALVEKNITEEVLKAMEEEFLTLKISGVDDKDGYKLIDEKRKLCKKTRGLAKDICESGRAQLIIEQKAWVAKEKSVTSRIKAVEDYLDSQLKIVDDEKQRLKEEKDKAEQIRLSERTAKMLDLGMRLQGDNYVLGGTMINILHVKVYDDYTFGEAIAGAEAEYKRQMELKAEEDAKLKAIQEKQEKEREQLDKEKREFEEKQRVAAQAEEDRQKKIKSEQEELAAQKEALEKAKLKNRASQLYSQGMSFNGTDHLFKDYVVSGELLKTLSDTDWEQKMTNEVIPEIAKRKAKIEEDNLVKIEKDKQDAIEADRKKREEEAAAKAKKEKEEKDAADALKERVLAEEARVAALRPDDEKYQEFRNTFENISQPEYATEEYQKFSTECKEVIRKMIVHFDKTKPQ